MAGLLRTIGRAGVFEILDALEKSPTGLQYNILKYDVVKRSTIDTALKAASEAGLVMQVGVVYQISPTGLKVLDLCHRLLELEEEAVPNLEDDLELHR